MALFNRKPRSPLPDNVGALLSEWGRREFDRSRAQELSKDADDFILSLHRRPMDESRRLLLIQGIREAGLREGGWTVYGAWEVLFANFLDPVPEEIKTELSEARVRFLLTLNVPNLYHYLNTMDSIMMKRIDPDAYARIHPFA